MNLLERHPDLFQKAMNYEKVDTETGERFTWVEGESLAELARPERVVAIKEQYLLRQACQKKSRAHLSLQKVFEADDEEGDTPCIMCHL